MVLESAAVGLFAAAAKAKTSGGSAFFLIIIVLFAVVYFAFLRPNQQKAKRARAEATQYEVGDTIVTIGGIVGRVEDLTDDRVTIITGIEDPETAGPDAGTRLIFVKNAIARRLLDVVEEDEEDEVEDDDESDETAEHEDHGDATEHEEDDHS